MQLSELEKYNSITIQCHDSPDADALGAGLGLYCYFRSKDKQVQLVYSGRNQISKTNLRLMVEKLGIPIEYLQPDQLTQRAELLITVDCQYGAGNVTTIEAEHVAVIDHHPLEIMNVEMARIQPNLGSCATLVWCMLREEGYPVNEDIQLATALYYGLYTDTNQFAELSNPLDMDMRESLTCNKSLLTLFRNSNLSLKELEIAGIAMIRYNYNADHHFAVIRSQPCDPNILGLISDFLLQVDEINTCVVYNEGVDGYKMSVRSCVKEVKANELAAYLAEGIGSGGGRYEKAGGFISRRLYTKKYPMLHSEAYFSNRMTEYFEAFEIIYADAWKITLDGMKEYRRIKKPIGYLDVSRLLKPGTRISVRNQEYNIDMTVEDDTLLAMERDGTIHSMQKDIFDRYLIPTEDEIPKNYFEQIEYEPAVKEWASGTSYPLVDYGRMCMPRDSFCIYAKKLEKGMKVFPKWDKDNYLLGMPGDYLVISADDLHNVYIEPGYDFSEHFERKM